MIFQQGVLMNTAAALKIDSNNERIGSTLTHKATSFHQPQILVVEDDVTFEPFWQAIVERADRNAKVFWATSELEAEDMIAKAFETGQGFDLVITDIFLSGARTGIDLWSKFTKALHGKIIITSAIEYEKFMQYFDKSDARPLFLQKPLIPHECVGAIYNSLHEGL